MADEQKITPEEKIRRALELLLTRGREHKAVKILNASGKVEKELGVLLLILLTYNRETDVIRLEKDIESMLDEDNIVELVREKFKRFEEKEHLLDRFVLSEDTAVTEIIRKIKLQNRLLEELKKRLEEGAVTKKAEKEKLLIITKPEEGADVYINEHVELEAKITRSIPLTNLTFQWYIEQYIEQDGRSPNIVNIHSGISGTPRLTMLDRFRIDEKAKIIVALERVVLGFFRTIARDEIEVVIRKRISGPIDLGAAEEMKTIKEERKLLASIADRLKKLKLPKPYRYVTALYHALGKKPLSSKISLWISRFAAWAEKHISDNVILGMVRRLLRLERQRVGMRINLLKGIEKPSRGPSELGPMGGIGQVPSGPEARQELPKEELHKEFRIEQRLPELTTPAVEILALKKHDYGADEKIQLNAIINGLTIPEEGLDYTWISIDPDTQEQKFIGGKGKTYSQTITDDIPVSRILVKHDRGSGRFFIMLKMLNLRGDMLESPKVEIEIT